MFRFGSVLHSLFRSLNPGSVSAILVVRAKEAVTPSERGGIVVREGHVVEIMMFSPRPKRKDVLQR
ncbi:unnamed protein product, partial [Mycena citricolor]